ncbi:hypothetical protein VNI00_014806 [Paramarasmius palmivorus]|uniref:Uncharacterized protein n=1 Tax=Paramarasmius palmivorus TaxID=297713 RepID=A0AAW0BR45_9AGAR
MTLDGYSQNTIHEYECNGNAHTGGETSNSTTCGEITVAELESTRFQGVQTPEYIEGETYPFKSISPRPFRPSDVSMTVKTPEYIRSPQRIEDESPSCSQPMQDVEIPSTHSTRLPSHSPHPPPHLTEPEGPMNADKISSGGYSGNGHEPVAESAGEEASPSQRMSKKRKRNGRDVDGVSGFLDLEAEVSHDEEDEEDEDDLGDFIARDDEDEEVRGPPINYHAISMRTELHEDELSQPDIDTSILDFAKGTSDKRTFQYASKVMLALYGDENKESIERREKKRHQLGLRSIWLLYVHHRRQRDVIRWWKDFCKTFKDKRPADCDVKIYSRRAKDNFLYVETQKPGLTAVAFRMCPHVVRNPAGPNGIKMVQMDVFEAPLSLDLLIQNFERTSFEHSVGSWVWLYTDPPHAPKKDERRYQTPPPPSQPDLLDPEWLISQDELASHSSKESATPEPEPRTDKPFTSSKRHKPAIPPEILKRCDSLRHYHGDAALIISSGRKEIKVLMLPRVLAKAIRLHQACQVDLHSEVIQCLYDPETLNTEFLSSCRYDVEHGLRVEKISTEFVKPLHRPLTPREGLLFFSSKHPLLNEYFPRVSGWEFQVGDRVVTKSSGIMGDVVAVEQDGLHTLDQEKIRRHVGWGVQKSWKTGDLVQHTIHGWDGFVLGQGEYHGGGHEQTLVHTRNDSNVERSYGTLNERDHVEVLVEPNFLVQYTPPQRSIFSRPQPNIPWMEAADYRTTHLKENSADVQRLLAEKHPGLLTPTQIDREIRNSRTSEIPWMYREVDLFANGIRGRARVTDVRYGCETASGLSVQVEWTAHGSVGGRFEVDYDHVLDFGTKMPLHVVEAPRPPFVVRVGYFHPKYNPTTYYGPSSSSRYLPKDSYIPGLSKTPVSSWTCQRDRAFDDVANDQGLRDRVISDNPRHVQLSDAFEQPATVPSEQPVTVPLPVVTQESIEKMLKFLESPINIQCRKMWSDDAHPSQRWLYELQGKPARQLFCVQLFGQDDQLEYTFKGQEKIVKVGYTELGDRCIFYKHERHDRIMPNTMKIETRGITTKTKKALYVLRGNYAGEYAVRIATVPPTLMGQSEAVFACCSVNVETGALNPDVQYELRSRDACQIELGKHIFTRVEKEAQEVKERTGVQRKSIKKRRTS